MNVSCLARNELQHSWPCPSAYAPSNSLLCVFGCPYRCILPTSCTRTGNFSWTCSPSTAVLPATLHRPFLPVVYLFIYFALFVPCIVLQLLQTKPTTCTVVTVCFTKRLDQVFGHEGPSLGIQLQGWYNVMSKYVW